MIEERLGELVPDVEYKVDHKSMIRMYEPGKITKQTNNLRKVVKGYKEILDKCHVFLSQEDKYLHRELLSEITGVTYDEIGE
jgi:cell fate regulator YaaT (PSP1 superfamily)